MQASRRSHQHTAPEGQANWYEAIVERDLVPDFLLRTAIRRLVKQRLREEDQGGPERQRAHLMRHIRQLKASPIAIQTHAANQQHYEVPAEFFTRVLGTYRKYSCCYWKSGDDLNQAERRMLDLTAERARLEDGQTILDLGCGWGSFSLYAAERFRHGTILGISNSHSQRRYIEGQARERGLSNVRIVTADINDFAPGERFDRIVSIEMFEHVRNYQALLRRVASWMQPDGLLFVHIFSHHKFAYPFDVRGDVRGDVRDSGDWMARHFFTGGQMPSDDLLLYFQDDVTLQEHWAIDGSHYQKTADAWLANMDAQRHELLALFAGVYGADQALKWFVRWRLFFLACSEVWGYGGGTEWIVSHYLFSGGANGK